MQLSSIDPSDQNSPAPQEDAEAEQRTAETSWLLRLRGRLFEPVDIASIAVFRMMFGAILFWEELRRMQVDGEEVGDVQVAVKAPDTHELLARIRARLPQDVQGLGTYLRIDRKRRSVERMGEHAWEDTNLQPLEYEVFKNLVDADGGVVGTWQLFERVFQDSSQDLDEPAIDNHKNRLWVCVANLRKKIDPDGEHDYVQTVHGIGYRFRVSDSD